MHGTAEKISEKGTVIIGTTYKVLRLYSSLCIILPIFGSSATF